MPAKTLMVLGTMSSAGKSLFVTGLCRLYARRGWKVAPFKAQNMSNNAAVCSGGEIGRAQAIQAYAAGVIPSVTMNPILLKPESDQRSQAIVLGQVWGQYKAAEYYTKVDSLWEPVAHSLDSLRQEAEIVFIEGAGSPAELNLMDGDIVNLAVARYAGAPCLLIGDIDRGGIFAQLLGTYGLLEKSDQALMKGFVVNKFRGDLALFRSGIDILEQRSGIPVLGVLPYLYAHGIADEDAAGLADKAVEGTGKVDIAVIWLPHISNFDDFDPLRMEADVRLRFVRHVEELGQPQVVILPGTKSTLADLNWLHESGLADEIVRLNGQGVQVVGICGGYQMLGQSVRDPQRIESSYEEVTGLGLLASSTIFDSQKTVTRSRARVISDTGFWKEIQGQSIDGYEIHMGRTESQHPLLEIDMREGVPVSAFDGASRPDGAVFGTYMHGLFDNDNFRRCWLKSLGACPDQRSFAEYRSAAYDRLADAIVSAIDIDMLDRIIFE